MPRILIADDDPIVLGLMRACLLRDGFQVDTVRDGREAIDTLQRDSGYDVVLTDYAMPRATGLEVIVEAERIDPWLPCVIVSAFHDVDLAVRAMSAGAVAFVPKPFVPAHLSAVVRSSLERRQLAQETVRLRLLAPMLERFTMLLANTIEAKDLSTQRHCERLVHVADAIAEELGLDPEARNAMRLGAALHDVGKIAVPEEILRAPRRLTKDETDMMRRHPEVGAAILEDIDTWTDVRMVVRHHHERYDGAGYPDGLRGEDIPVGARIVAVADAFDVMRSGRAYAPARRLEAINDELRAQSGRQFDPACVTAFFAAVESGALHWDENSEAMLVGSSQGATDIMRPRGAGLAFR